jgi:hypothetical protein
MKRRSIFHTGIFRRICLRFNFTQLQFRSVSFPHANADIHHYANRHAVAYSDGNQYRDTHAATDAHFWRLEECFP